jgi:hypothetical protein
MALKVSRKDVLMDQLTKMGINLPIMGENNKPNYYSEGLLTQIIDMGKEGLLGQSKLKKAVKEETDTAIDKRIAERFEILELMAKGCIDGDHASVICSGPAGLGKSYTIEEALKEYDPSEEKWTFVKGYLKATGLYKKLYDYKNPGQILVIDDADSVFFDDTALNILKAVLDTSKRRRVHWGAETDFVSDRTGEIIPRSFDFEGSVIFITNLDFEEYVESGHRFAESMAALMSRSHYVSLMMKTNRDYIVRLEQLFKLGLMNDVLTRVEDRREVMDFMREHMENLRELSARMTKKLAGLKKVNGASWKKIAKGTNFKTTSLSVKL